MREHHIEIAIAVNVRERRAASDDGLEQIRARLLLDPEMIEQESRVAYQLKVTLTECDPPIWRRLLVPSGYTLCQLHGAIQAVMGWQNYHLHSFEIQGVEYGDDPEKELGFQDDRGVTLLRALPPMESTFEYVYDFGDHWVHEVVVEKQIAASEAGAVPKRLCRN